MGTITVPGVEEETSPEAAAASTQISEVVVDEEAAVDVAAVGVTSKAAEAMNSPTEAATKVVKVADTVAAETPYVFLTS